MANYTVLYNPLSGNVNENDIKTQLSNLLKDDKLEFFDMTSINGLGGFIAKIPAQDNILLVGGDGTLNRFVNTVDTAALKNKVYYFAAGNGNDFWTDIGRKRGDAPVCIDDYIKNLPEVTVKGKTYKFLNGIGFGIDGYCCEVGDKLKAAGKKVNYTGIAIKGLLFHFKPSAATVIVDGVERKFKKVWIAPAMLGRYYGGGMIPTPEQDRNAPEQTLSTCIFYGKGRLKTLMVFPSIFKGEHVKKTKMVQVLKGKEITVKFAKPCALQIDGETVLDVTEYTVKSAEFNSAALAA